MALRSKWVFVEDGEVGDGADEPDRGCGFVSSSCSDVGGKGCVTSMSGSLCCSVIRIAESSRVSEISNDVSQHPVDNSALGFRLVRSLHHPSLAT